MNPFSWSLSISGTADDVDALEGAARDFLANLDAAGVTVNQAQFNESLVVDLLAVEPAPAVQPTPIPEPVQ